MIITEISEEARQQKRVRRKSWDKECYIYFEGDFLGWRDESGGIYHIGILDMLASDWEVYEEAPKIRTSHTVQIGPAYFDGERDEEALINIINELLERVSRLEEKTNG